MAGSRSVGPCQATEVAVLVAEPGQEAAGHIARKIRRLAAASASVLDAVPQPVRTFEFISVQTRKSSKLGYLV
jgi:hypothetical protein